MTDIFICWWNMRLGVRFLLSLRAKVDYSNNKSSQSRKGYVRVWNSSTKWATSIGISNPIILFYSSQCRRSVISDGRPIVENKIFVNPIVVLLCIFHPKWCENSIMGNLSMFGQWDWLCTNFWLVVFHLVCGISRICHKYWPNQFNSLNTSIAAQNANNSS